MHDYQFKLAKTRRYYSSMFPETCYLNEINFKKLGFLGDGSANKIFFRQIDLKNRFLFIAFGIS